MKKLTTEQFVERSKIIHNNKYDYSKTIYIGSKIPVTIICPIHGDFNQTPNPHLKGCGCLKCGNTNEFTEEHNKKFINDSIKVHGDKYDYSKVNYMGNKKQVEIICKIHGSFDQTPNSHLRGNKCPECAIIERKILVNKNESKKFFDKMKELYGNRFDFSNVTYINTLSNIKLICEIHGEFEQTPNCLVQGRSCTKCGKNKPTTEMFIERAKSVYGNKYNYDKTIYVDTKHKVIVSCNAGHKDFTIIPRNHINGARGCKDCWKEEIKARFSKFVIDANKLHENKYDYSASNYINSTTEISIICPIHGPFLQLPSKHLLPHGCPDCGGSRPLNKEIFIERATAIHGDKYDYSKVVYINNNIDIIIICPTHGDFNQSPHSHMEGHNCNKCSNSGISNPETKWLDSLNILEDNRQFTIKYTYFDFDSQKVKNKSYSFDGYDPITNTIYEYHGSYFHGDPRYFKPWDINKKTHSSFGELYNNTLIKRNFALALGYTIVENWDSERIEVYSPNNITSPICSDLLQL